jgi:hypothetical protein
MEKKRLEDSEVLRKPASSQFREDRSLGYLLWCRECAADRAAEGGEVYIEHVFKYREMVVCNNCDD